MSGNQDSMSGQRVLIVEDDYTVAYAVADMATALGAHILGPLPSVAAARAAVTPNARIDLVLLDLRLQGEMSWPVVDLLQQRGIPVVLTSNTPPREIPARYADVPLHPKPMNETELAQLLQSSLSQ